MVGIQDWWRSVRQIPQTQKDIRTIASVTEQIQSPQLQHQIIEVREDIEDLGKTLLVLQAVGTAAMVGMFLLQFRETQK